MLRAKSQRASKSRSPYATQPASRVSSKSVLARGRTSHEVGQASTTGQSTRVTQPPSTASSSSVRTTQIDGESLQQSLGINIPSVPVNASPVANIVPVAEMASSSGASINQGTSNCKILDNKIPGQSNACGRKIQRYSRCYFSFSVGKISTVGPISREVSFPNSYSILGNHSATIDQLLEASISENSNSLWIIGSSNVHWAQQYAENTNQLDLGLKQFAIIWNGKMGMVWENLSSVVARMSKSSPPSILILHCGGNNIGYPQNTLKGIQKFMKRTLAQLGQDLPNTLIVWSHILPHGNWRKSLSNFEGEKVKKRINSAIATFVLNQLHGASIKYPDIQVSYKRLFRIDRVHLSDLGNSILINTWKNAIVQFVTTSTRTYP
ncbi:uncharacterized protein LOC125660295 [Ostrea edulis]|uniref:uncharacterized protein LOC125660295 n=1 Tax=Ostrea edulis TaxID=37623 RepID=UPI0024AF3B33|nr:uncharacterized protein LOC125660295 [Ostrea edulis]